MPVLGANGLPLVFEAEGVVRLNLWKVPDRSGDKLALHVPEGFARSSVGALPYWGVTNAAPQLVLVPSLLNGSRMDGVFGRPAHFRQTGERERPQPGVRFAAASEAAP